jgi:hypothetical protein
LKLASALKEKREQRDNEKKRKSLCKMEPKLEKLCTAKSFCKMGKKSQLFISPDSYKITPGNTPTATRKFCLDGCVGFLQCPK